MNPHKPLQEHLLQRACQSALLALGLASPAAYAIQAHCVEDGGSDTCLQPIQLEPRYYADNYANGICDSRLPPPPPLPPAVPPYALYFSSEGAALQHSLDVFYCSNRRENLCVQAYNANQGDHWQPDPLWNGPHNLEPKSSYWTDSSNRSYEAFHVRWAGFNYEHTACAPEQYQYGVLSRDMPWYCPPMSVLADRTTNPWTATCIKVESDVCPVGNPIRPDQGVKTFAETDFAPGGGALTFSRNYRSNGYLRPVGSGVARVSVLGNFWQTPFDSRLFPISGSSSVQAAILRDDGNLKYFRTDGSETPHYGTTAVESLVHNADGSWTFTDAGDRVESYDAQARLTAITERGGLKQTLAYDSQGRLASVTDAFGRALTFAYEVRKTGGTLVTLTQPDGGQIVYTIDSRSNLLSVTYPGGATRSYSYPAGSPYNAITGITDENGDAYEAIEYDSQGRATASYLAPNKANNQIGRHSFVFNNSTTTTVTSPLGAQSTLTFATVAGVSRLASSTQPCASCGSTAQTRSYDAQGYPDKTTDFNGVQTDRDFDARGLEVQRIEASNITGTDSPRRRTVTTWHGQFRVPLSERLYNAADQLEAWTEWRYNARGQVTMKCEIDTSETGTGNQLCGSGRVPAGAKVRRWTYSYCEAADVAAANSTCPVLGLPKSSNGPRSASDPGMAGADDVTTLSYYPSTDETGCEAAAGACHRKGDLWRSTNALGQVEEIVRYDRNGNELLRRDANSVATSYSYDARNRLQQITVHASPSGSPGSGDATTLVSYDDAGNIVRLQQPNGSSLRFGYDTAHRLVSVQDSLDNRIVYTLDADGNRIAEDTYDSSHDPAVPGSGLKRSLARTFNTLSRFTQQRNAQGQLQFDAAAFDSAGLNDGYDGNGNSVKFANGLGVVREQSFDALNRLIASTQDLGGGTAVSNALTSFGYDARDNLRSIIDADGLTTSYGIDGLNNHVRLDSPDTGRTDYGFDLAGNRVSETDNRGIAATYTYDALNRLTSIAYADSSQNISFAYDQGDGITQCSASFPRGRLSRITDATGTTTYCYDRRGNVMRKTQLTEGVALAVEYSHTLDDQLASLTYPDGSSVSYAYDAVGRVNRITYKASASAVAATLIDNVSYYPFGPVRQLTYGNGRSLTKTYDENYVIDRIASSDGSGLVLDFTANAMGQIVAAADSIGAIAPTRKYSYDRLNRLSRVDDGGDVLQESYDYSKAGDRLGKQLAGQTPQVYDYLAGTHRLRSIAGGSSTSRTYDANGNTTSRGGAAGFVYGPRNRLDSVSGLAQPLTNGYNGRGERVFKRLDPAVAATKFVYDESGQLLYEHPALASNASRYIYLDRLPVALLQGSNLRYLETDHLGTPRLAFEPTANAVQWSWSLFGSAFGEHAPVSHGSGNMKIPLRYPGQYADTESGLNYNYLRDYEPETGRYLESDPLGLLTQTSTYSYAAGNALDNTDPLGLFNMKATEVFNGSDYVWKYEFSFSSCAWTYLLEGSEQIKPQNRWAKAMKWAMDKLPWPQPTGDIDIDSVSKRCRCLGYDKQLEQAFRRNYGKPGQWLSEADASAALNLLREEAADIGCNGCYNNTYNSWGSLMGTARARGTHSIRRIFGNWAN